MHINSLRYNIKFTSIHYTYLSFPLLKTVPSALQGYQIDTYPRVSHWLHAFLHVSPKSTKEKYGEHLQASIRSDERLRLRYLRVLSQAANTSNIEKSHLFIYNAEMLHLKNYKYCRLEGANLTKLQSEKVKGSPNQASNAKMLQSKNRKQGIQLPKRCQFANFAIFA